MLSKNGYTFGYRSAEDEKALAGTVARLRALSTSPATTAEMHRVAAPHLHPERVPRSEPAFKTEPEVPPPVSEGE